MNKRDKINDIISKYDFLEWSFGKIDNWDVNDIIINNITGNKFFFGTGKINHFYHSSYYSSAFDKDTPDREFLDEYYYPFENWIKDELNLVEKTKKEMESLGL